MNGLHTADKNPIVLLVEDDDVYRELIHRLLDDHFEVVDASTGDQALALLGTTVPDCVLLDYRLPDYSGLELLPQFIERGLAVVMMTAEGSEDVAVKALKCGSHDYLVKRSLTQELLTRTIGSSIELNLLQRQLATQQQELQSFVASASHDLKGPLRAIRNFSQFSIDALNSDDREELADLLLRIQNSTVRLGGLVDVLLEYTRVGGTKPSHQSVDLNDCVAAPAIEFKETLDECGGRLEIETLPTVHGDPHLLSQLLQNLIGNGLKFRGEAPPVVRITSQQVGEEIHVSVSDNGIGIDSKYHDRVFQPLKRLHTESEYEGYGIGLATCQRIVDKHDGRIWLESVLDQGSTFHLAFAR